MKISKSGDTATVYAWVLYEEYSFDGRDVVKECASHIPTVITFDTSSGGDDPAFYDVIEYWEPRDGAYYIEDIHAKFPINLWRKALRFT